VIVIIVHFCSNNLPVVWRVAAAAAASIKQICRAPSDLAYCYFWFVQPSTECWPQSF
jgi:hypothetical protein